MMKAMRCWVFVMMAVGMVLAPLHSAGAWGYSGGYDRGGGYGGYHGGGRYGGHYGYGYGDRGYGHGHGYYGGCRGCGAVGAGIVGLTIGTIIGSAMIEAERPPVVVRSPLPPPRRCASVIVDGGLTYYNCGGRYADDYGGW